MDPDPNPLFRLGESTADFERSRDSDDAKAACAKFQTFASLILSFIHFVLMRCLPDGFLKGGFMNKKLGPIPFWRWIRATFSFAFKGCQKILVSLEPKSIGSMSPGFHLSDPRHLDPSFNDRAVIACERFRVQREWWVFVDLWAFVGCYWSSRALYWCGVFLYT